MHIVHGMAEFARRYARLAARLNAAGFAVWAHDHRGHGDNTTPPVGLGHFADANGWRALVDDAWAVSASMSAAHPALPLILFGHSMGSFVAQTLMAEHGDAYAGVVLSGSNGPPNALEAVVRQVARAQRRLLGGRAPGRWLQALVLDGYNRRFAPTRTAADWLTRDDAEVDAYLANPLCGFPLTSQSWFDFLEGRRPLGTRAHLDRIPKALPVYIISGTRDPVGEESRGPQRLRRIYEQSGMTNLTLRLYEGARHELVNETNRDEVTDDVIRWLESVVAGEP